MLIGREREKRRIVELLDGSAPTPGAIRLIQIDGPIGIGKSALLSSVLPSVPARTFLSHGDRVLAQGPLTAHRAMIETLLEDDLEPLFDEGTPRSLALRCAAALSGSRTIIAVDDAQWLDAASEEFLIGLILAPLEADLTIVLVHRLGQEPASIVSRARRRGAQHDHITLDALPDAAIEQLVSGLAPRQVASVIEVAEGNPLFARTALAAFRRRPEAQHLQEVLRFADGTRSAVLSAAVADDVESLPEEARRALETLALLGSSDPEALGAVSGMDPAACKSGIELLRERGLLSANPHESLHPVVRFSVYQNTDLEWRGRAHRAAAHLPGTDLFHRAEHLAQLGAELEDDEVETLMRASSLALGSEPRAVLRWLSSIPAHHRTVGVESLLARAEILNGEVADALERLRPLAAESPDSTEVRVLLANALRISNQPEEARAMLARETETVSPELLREIIDVIALLDGGLPEELLEQLSGMPGAENRTAAAIYRTMEMLSIGEVRQARRAFRGVPEWVLQASGEVIRDTLHAAACAVWCAYMLDLYETGAQIATRALRVAGRFGQADVFANLNAALAFCLAQLGALDEADEAAEQAIVDAGRYGPPGLVGMARAGLVVSAFGRRDPRLLEERYEDLKRTEVPTFGWWRRAVQGIRIRASAVTGDPEPYTVLLGMSKDAMSGLHHADAALVAAMNGDPELAIDLVHKGLAITQEQGAQGQEAMLQTTLAEILLGSERPERAEGARELLLAARETFEQYGMGLQLGRVGGALARAEGVLAQMPDPLEALTPREREVAGLIAEGLTNREIAEHLVISPRTAEEHASKVMKKLGAPSRAAIGALVHGAGRGDDLPPAAA